MTNRRLFLSATAAASLALALPAHAQNNPKKLRLALLPDENAATIIQNAQPLRKYLEETWSREVELIVTTDYSSMIEAMRFGRIEVAYFGPFSYVLARSKADIDAIAVGVSRGSPTYKSVIVVPTGAPIQSVAQLRGRTVGFGDQASTSSHLVPRATIQDLAGLQAEKDYKAVYLGAHDAVARAVETGKVDAGALSEATYASLLKSGKIDATKVRVLAESKPIPNYPIAIQNKLDAQLKAAVRQAFLDLKDPAILKSFRAEGFVATDDAAYDVLRTTAKVLNLDLAKMQ